MLAQVAGAMVGIPPYVTAAAVTASRGGDLSAIAKSAAVAYIAGETAKNTEIGKSIASSTSGVGQDFTKTLISDYGFAPSTASMIGSATTSGLNSSIIGGVRSILTGQDIGTGVATGFAQGAIYSGTDSYFKDLQKDPNWGLSPDVTKQLSNVASSGLNALLTGKDPSAAIGNYLSYKLLQTAGNELSSAAKSSYQALQEKLSSSQNAEKTLQERQAAYNNQFSDLDKRQEEYNAKVADYQKQIDTAWNPVQAKLDAQKSAYDTATAAYNEQKKIYDNTSLSIDARNAAADKMATFGQQATDASKAYDALFSANKDLYNSIKATGDQLALSKKDLDTGFAKLQDTTGKELLDAKSEFDKTVTEYDAAKAKSEEATKAYENQLSEAVTKDVTIDAISNGLIKPVQTNEDGSVTFENGITVNPDGKMFKDGQEMFTAANGIEQKELKFTDSSGHNYAFDKNSQRLNTDSDIQKYFKDNYGLDISAEDAQKYAGNLYGKQDDSAIKDDVTNRIAEQFKQAEVKPPENVEELIQPGGNTAEVVEKTIDPFKVTEEEAKTFIEDALGREARPEEIAMIQNIATAPELTSQQVEDQAQIYEALQNAFASAETPEKASEPDVLYAALSPENQKIATDAGNAYLTGNATWDQVAPVVNAAVESDIQSGYLEPNGDGSYTAPDGTVYEMNADTGVWDASNVGEVGGEGLGQPEADDLKLMDEFLSLYQPTESATAPTQPVQVEPAPAEITPTEVAPSEIAPTYIAPSEALPPEVAPVEVLPSEPLPKSPLELISSPEVVAQESGLGSVQPVETVVDSGIGFAPSEGAGTVTGVGAGTDAGTGLGSSTESGLGSGLGSGSGLGAGDGFGVGVPAPAEVVVPPEVVANIPPEVTGALPEPTGALPAPVTPSAPAPAGGTTAPTSAATGGTGGGGSLGGNISLLSQILALGGMQNAAQSPAQIPLKPSFLFTGNEAPSRFESPLESFLREQTSNYLNENAQNDYFQPKETQEQPMRAAFYDYGEQPTLDEIFNPEQTQQAQQAQAFGMLNPSYQTQQPFGSLSPLMVATGGSITGTRHGRYAHGGMATPLMAAGGKMRVDFRHGDAVTGPGDGQSDDIPAMLADGEFVFPADVVAALGNGSTKAGSDKLYDMMHSIRAHVRSAKPKDLPPEINSPLDFLKTQPKKRARSK